MQPKIAANMFRNLVAETGGKEAAAAVITSAVGHPISIGSLTRIENGNAEVPLLWAWALMDATKNRCFDTYRASSVQAAGDGCLYALSGEASEEAGQAISAGIRAAQSGDAGDYARAAVEAREAEAKFGEMGARFESFAKPP